MPTYQSTNPVPTSLPPSLDTQESSGIYFQNPDPLPAPPAQSFQPPRFDPYSPPPSTSVSKSWSEYFKNKPVLVGITLILLGLLGGSGYGIYRYLQPPQAALETFIQEGEALLGTIQVCKVLIDHEGNITAGENLPSLTTIIPGTASKLPKGFNKLHKLPDTSFSYPLSLNTDLFFTDGKPDSWCQNYDNLALGGYFYGEELGLNNNWATPKFNDQWSMQIQSLADFFTYDQNLWNLEADPDKKRNFNSDGHIVLNANRPSRTLVVINQYLVKPTPATTPKPITDLACYFSCESDDQCREGLICTTIGDLKRCANPACSEDDSCTCTQQPGSSTSTGSSDAQKIEKATSLRYAEGQANADAPKVPEQFLAMAEPIATPVPTSEPTPAPFGSFATTAQVPASSLGGQEESTPIQTTTVASNQGSQEKTEVAEIFYQDPLPANNVTKYGSGVTSYSPGSLPQAGSMDATVALILIGILGLGSGYIYRGTRK